MRRPLRLGFVLLTALLAVASAPAAAPLVGSVELAPLDGSSAPERLALVRLTPDGGPLYPAVGGPLRVGVDGLRPVVQLGGACPTELRFGGSVTLVNGGDEALDVQVGDAEPSELAAAGELVVERGSTESTLIRLADADWACALAWTEGPHIVATARSAGRTTWELDWGEVAAPEAPEEGGATALSEAALVVWLAGRQLCPTPASEPGGPCLWSVAARSDGDTVRLEPVRLTAEMLRHSGEGF